MKENIYHAYLDHEKGYIVTVEDFLVYLQAKEYNYALSGEGSLFGNYPPGPEGSYFEVKGIKLGELIEKQHDEVIEGFYKLIR